jgi:medium-chain acyl-[acyl-carrier-protein] hydrolase
MERRAIEDGFKPLPEPGPEGIKGRFSVRLSDTDLNRHVNHIHHILWALECVPQEFLSGNVPAEIEAAYKGEIMFGQNVIVQTRRSDDRVFNHKLVLEYDDREVARLRTRWEDKTKNPGES